MTAEKGILRRLRGLPLRWRIFGYLAAFVGLLLLLLWLLQVVFLDEIYRAIKIRSLESASLSLAQSIDDPEIETLMEQIAWQNQMCVRILDEEGQDLYSCSFLPSCVIHTMPDEAVFHLWDDARREGSLTTQAFHNMKPPVPTALGKNQKRLPMQNFSNEMQHLVQARLVNRADGSRVMILVNGVVSPVGATVDTLRTQFLWIAIFMLAGSLGLALLISRLVSRPIAAISRTAESLALGRYDLSFPRGGCREIDRLSATLTYAASELSKTEQLRRDLVANVSHDLRTPLTMIAGYAEMMRDIPGENNGENAQVIVDEANRLAGLVKDMLDLSRLQAGAARLDLEVLSLTQTVRDIVLRWNKLITPENCRLAFEGEEELFVLADGIKLSQVIYNLAGNAISHTPSGGQVLIRQLRQDGFVLLQVIDQGPGIPPEEIPRIWERYHTRRQDPGQVGGLGLAIVKAVLDLHGAQYGVESVVGEGSVFWFRLPLAQPPL